MKVLPIFKADENRKFSNYRLISILPIFCKILERVVHVRLMKYLTKDNILSDNHFGFRKNNSTSMAVNLANSIDEKEFSAGVFINLSKIFDTANNITGTTLL